METPYVVAAAPPRGRSIPGGHDQRRWLQRLDAEKLAKVALARFRGLGDRWGVAAALSVRARQAHLRGDRATAARDSKQSLEIFRALGDQWGQLQAAETLGELARVAGDAPRATRLLREGLRIAEELGLRAEASCRISVGSRC